MCGNTKLALMALLPIFVYVKKLIELRRLPTLKL